MKTRGLVTGRMRRDRRLRDGARLTERFKQAGRRPSIRFEEVRTGDEQVCSLTGCGTVGAKSNGPGALERELAS